MTKPQADNHLLVQSMFEPALPLRGVNSHKGSHGSVAVIGGADGMVGAVLLASRAALLSGAGRVYATILSEKAPTVDILHPEIMMRSASALMELPQLNCIVMGPGLGMSDAAIKLLELVMAMDVSLLLDADALNLIAKHPYLSTNLKNRHPETIITPHPGEAAKLLSTTTEHIQKNRTDNAIFLATRLNVSCVLKGAGSVCAHHDGSWFINTSGNAGLASGGTGDVLSGVIGSLIAQGLAPFAAAKLGVYLHGAAADALVKRNVGPVGLTASELVVEIRNCINQLNLTHNI